MLVVVRKGRFLIEGFDFFRDVSGIYDVIVWPKHGVDAVGFPKDMSTLLANRSIALKAQCRLMARAMKQGAQEVLVILSRRRMHGGRLRRLGEHIVAHAQHVYI